MSGRYRGPEQEIWSLGVTLYTLVMRENLFKTVDDAITASYSIPLDVSIGLNIYQIICSDFTDMLRRLINCRIIIIIINY